MMLVRSLTLLTASLVAAATASAQQPTDVPPVKPDQEWIAVVIAIVLMLCVGAVSVMTPKRTHQD